MAYEGQPGSAFVDLEIVREHVASAAEWVGSCAAQSFRESVDGSLRYLNGLRFDSPLEVLFWLWWDAVFDEDFNQWWQAYPKRVGRIAAKAAYTKARKSGVPVEVLLDGIAAYRRLKPSYADWCHPTTWLNQGRWMDEAPEVEVRSCPRCGGVPPCRSYTQCNERLFPSRKASA